MSENIKVANPDYVLAYSAVVCRACAAYAYLQCDDSHSAECALKEIMEIRRMVEGYPIVLESTK